MKLLVSAPPPLPTQRNPVPSVNFHIQKKSKTHEKNEEKRNFEILLLNRCHFPSDGITNSIIQMKNKIFLSAAAIK